MPALAPVPPEVLKRILEMYGCVVIEEDDYNWVLVRSEQEIPLVLPKKGDFVAVDVMMDALHKVKMDNGTYFALKDRVQGSAQAAS